MIYLQPLVMFLLGIAMGCVLLFIAPFIWHIYKKWIKWLDKEFGG